MAITNEEIVDRQAELEKALSEVAEAIPKSRRGLFFRQFMILESYAKAGLRLAAILSMLLPDLKSEDMGVMALTVKARAVLDQMEIP